MNPFLQLNFRRFLKPCITLVLFLSFWQTFATLGLINIRVVSYPSEIVMNALQLYQSGNLLNDVGESVKRVLFGVLLGSFVGVCLGIYLGLVKKVNEFIGFMIEIFRPIPPIAWIPIAILWFGIGNGPAYFLVSLGSFFPMFSSTKDSVRNIERKYLDIASNMGASRWLKFKSVVIPLVLPELITGFRVALGVGWIIVITAEMVGAQNGLGYMIQLNRTMLQTPYVIVGMITIGCVGLLFSLIMDMLEMLIIPWKKRMAILSS